MGCTVAELLDRISSRELAEWQALGFVRWEDAERQRLQTECDRDVERMKRERRR